MSILKPVDKNVDEVWRLEVDLHITFSKSTSQAVSDPNFSRPLAMYRGENAAEKCVRDLQQES